MTGACEDRGGDARGISKLLLAKTHQLERDDISSHLSSDAWNILRANDQDGIIELFRTEAPDVVLLDLSSLDECSMSLLKRLRAIDHSVPLVVTTKDKPVRAAVESMRLGAFDYVPRPIDRDELLGSLERAVAARATPQEGPTRTVDCGGLEEMMGYGAAVQDLYRHINQVARTTYTAVICGETGSGKELVARRIHNLSERADGPFVAVDCGAIPEALIESELFGHERGAFTGAHASKQGMFELASGGTLFLDEIGNLPMRMQRKLLRTIQERQVQPVGAEKPRAVRIRILVASHVRLETLVQQRRFRTDLFHRLNEYVVEVPALRGRREDIPYLSRRFLREACAELGRTEPRVSAEAEQRLLVHAWPGNVRELKNVMRRAALAADDEIKTEHLYISFHVEQSAIDDVPLISDFHGFSLKDEVRKRSRAYERTLITQVLEKTEGNKSEAARLLQIDYKTIHYKIKEYGISVAGR